MLFAKKCLLVEGWHDYRFMTNLLEVIKNYDFRVIMLDGCGSKLWKILDTLDIPYKVLYDVDKLTVSLSKLTVNHISLMTLSKNFMAECDEIGKYLDDLEIDYDQVKTILNFKGHSVFLKVIAMNTFAVIMGRDPVIDLNNAKLNQEFKKNKDKFMESIGPMNPIPFTEFKKKYNKILSSCELNGSGKSEFLNGIKQNCKKNEEAMRFIYDKLGLNYGCSTDELIEKINQKTRQSANNRHVTH